MLSYITLGQQYGFQRIVPCVDRMASKTYYTTTIVADSRYTTMVSNGDLAPGFYDPATNEAIRQTEAQAFLAGNESVLAELAVNRPEESGDSKIERQVLKYYNHKVNMAPYLFFLGTEMLITLITLINPHQLIHLETLHCSSLLSGMYHIVYTCLFMM